MPFGELTQHFNLPYLNLCISVYKTLLRKTGRTRKRASRDRVIWAYDAWLWNFRKFLSVVLMRSDLNKSCYLLTYWYSHITVMSYLKLLLWRPYLVSVKSSFTAKKYPKHTNWCAHVHAHTNTYICDTCTYIRLSRVNIHFHTFYFRTNNKAFKIIATYFKEQHNRIPIRHSLRPADGIEFYGTHLTSWSPSSVST